jgi:hypothetical protein
LDRLIDLPPPVTRWTRRRKAAVVIAVWSGKITLVEAIHRYALSFSEFRTWETAVQRAWPWQCE